MPAWQPLPNPSVKPLVKNAHRVCPQTPGRGREVFSYLTVIFLSFYLTESFISAACSLLLIEQVPITVLQQEDLFL